MPRRCANWWPSASAAGRFATWGIWLPVAARVAARSSSWPGRVLATVSWIAGGRTRRRCLADLGGCARGRSWEIASREVSAMGAARIADRAARRPELRPLDRWQRVLADYATSGVSVDDHAMAVLRHACPSERRLPMLATSAQLARMPHGCSVTVAGMVIARQRPGTAKGTMFLLFEDEWGTINLIVPGRVYEARRALARAEPLLLARGRLERARASLNVIVRELGCARAFPCRARGGDRRVGRSTRVRRLPGGRWDRAGRRGAGRRRDGSQHAGRRATDPELCLGKTAGRSSQVACAPSSVIPGRAWTAGRRTIVDCCRSLKLHYGVVCPA